MSVKTIIIAVVAVLVIALALDAIYVVDQRQRAIVLRFGEVVSGPDGESPGLHFKMPIADKVNFFDGRVLTLDNTPETYYTREEKPLIVDWFAKWRIMEPRLYYTSTLGDEESLKGKLGERVSDGLRNQIGRRDMHEVISGERDELMQELTNELSQVMMTEFGVTVIDIRVKKIDLPEEVSNDVYARMRQARQVEAQQYRSAGTEQKLAIEADAERQAIVIESEARRDAERIRGDGDAESARIYAEAYGQDPEFYEFYRSINAYVTVFEDGQSLLVLDPSSDFFQYLKGGSNDGQ